MNRNTINNNFIFPVLQEISLSAQELIQSLNVDIQFDSPEQFVKDGINGKDGIPGKDGLNGIGDSIN